MKFEQELLLWLLLFLTAIKSVSVCDTFYDRKWKCESDDCFTKDSQTVRISSINYNAEIKCADQQSPNMYLLNCSGTRYINKLTFTECGFQDTFHIGEFLHNIDTLSVQIQFEQYKASYFYIHFSNMNGLQTVAINKLRVDNLFNLSFGENLNSLRNIKINDHNIREVELVFPEVSFLSEVEVKNGTLATLRALNNVPKLIHLDLSWNNISRLGSLLFVNLKNLRHINLIGNQLEHLDEKLFSGLVSLKSLILSKNRLTSIENWIFPSRLTELQLDDNKLQHLSSSLMNAVDSNADITVTLSGNDWKCNCTVLEWLKKNIDRISDYKNISCAFSQRNYTNFTIQLEKSDFDHLCFVPNERNVISLAVFLLVALTVTAFVCYHRYTIIVLFHDNILAPCFLCMDGQTEEKDFDLFVCCGENNLSTSEIFVKELEPRLRLCIPERDWETEARVSANVAYSIRSSRATLLFVTKKTVAEMWFQVQLRGAYNKRLEDEVHKMILVIGEDVKNVSMKEDIRQLIRNEPKLVWGERLFWKKLRYELRRTKRTN